MAVNIVVPELSESVVEATVSEWMVNVGDSVSVGDVLVVLETDKVSLEVAAEQDGVISSIDRQVDEDVTPGEVLGIMEAGNGAAASGAAEASAQEPVAATAASAQPATSADADGKAETQPYGQPPAARNASDGAEATAGATVTPVARRVAEAHNVDLAQVSASDGRKISKDDVEKFVASQQNGGAATSQPTTTPAAQPARNASAAAASNGAQGAAQTERDDEERVKLSRRRRTIAKRLVEVQQTAAILTTFNEVDMTAVMELRSRRKENFKEAYGVSLGLSSFFVKATLNALKAFPQLNAEIDGDFMVLKHHYDIGIAIGDEEGLVVPVLRDTDRMSFAEIESGIRQFAAQIKDGSLPIDALMGGTFTITNGGVFGSLMSTPILNAPQVGILGLHGIKDRAMVIDGQIVVRPMMYVALSYDHRIVDGREAVQFLVKIKEGIEDPELLLIS